MKRLAYHCTEVNPEIIIKDGWKVGKGFTKNNLVEDLYEKYLPDIPVFCSDFKTKVWASDAKYCCKLDISNLQLYPDFGHLIDYGAYYEEGQFYWEHENDIVNNLKLKRYVLDNCEYLTIYAEDFTGEDSLNLIGTCCVDGNELNKSNNRRIIEFRTQK